MERFSSLSDHLRSGRPVVICDDDQREGEGDLAFAAKYMTESAVNFALTYGRGLLCVSMTPERAAELGIERQKSNGLDEFGTPFGMPISLKGPGSGISASARASTILATAHPQTLVGDFAMPGHVMTLIAHSQGLSGRDGHTEAVLELLKIAGVEGPGVLCEVLRSDGAIAKWDDLRRLGEEHELPIIKIAELKSEISATGQQAE